MAQFINAISKNEKFVMLHYYDSVAEELFPAIHSIPVNQLSHDMLQGSGERPIYTLVLMRDGDTVTSLTSLEDYDITEPFYLMVDGAVSATATKLMEITDFFLLP
jgi:hypothetical protein